MRLLDLHEACTALSVSRRTFNALREQYPAELAPVVIRGTLVRWTDEQIDHLILALQRDTTSAYSTRGGRRTRRAA